MEHPGRSRTAEIPERAEEDSEVWTGFPHSPQSDPINNSGMDKAHFRGLSVSARVRSLGPPAIHAGYRAMDLCLQPTPLISTGSSEHP